MPWHSKIIWLKSASLSACVVEVPPSGAQPYASLTQRSRVGLNHFAPSGLGPPGLNPFSGSNLSPPWLLGTPENQFSRALGFSATSSSSTEKHAKHLGFSPRAVQALLLPSG